MKRILLFILVLSTTISLFGQEKISTKEIDSIVEEGKLLYRSELATRNGLSLAVSKGIDQSDIRGFFSLISNDTTYWICYSKSEPTQVLGTVTFDSTSTIGNAQIDISARPFTPLERTYFLMNEQAIGFSKIESGIRSYENTVMRTIPIIYKGVRKIYLLTQSTLQNEVIFGNDYLITLDNLNSISSFKRLHNNMIAIEYGKKQENTNQLQESLHSHNDKTGDLITPTDICIFLLNGKKTKWKQHTVLTPNYVYVWDFKSNQLSVVTRESVEKAYSKEQSAK